MESQPTAAAVLRKVLFLALFGFLAVILAGPVIAICSVLLSVILSAAFVLLPFVLIGLIFWLPFQAFVLGQKINWPRTGASIRVLFGSIFGVFGKVFGGSVRLVKAVSRKVGTAALFVAGIFLDVLGGAFVGAVLGAVGGVMHDDAPGRVPVAALIGAGVGLVVALVRRAGRNERERVVEAQVVMPVKAHERPRVVLAGLRGCVEVPVR